MQRNEHREHPRGLADLLLPYALIEDGILLQQDGSLLTGWSFRGPDMMSAAPAEMDRSVPDSTMSCGLDRLDDPMRCNQVSRPRIPGRRRVS